MMIAQTQHYCGKSNLKLSPIGVDVWVSPILGNGFRMAAKMSDKSGTHISQGYPTMISKVVINIPYVSLRP
jgi:hypothetical protein